MSAACSSGKWELREAALHFQFNQQAQAPIPALREMKLFIVHEAVGIVLVGEDNAKFVRGEATPEKRPHDHGSTDHKTREES